MGVYGRSLVSEDDIRATETTSFFKEVPNETVARILEGATVHEYASEALIFSQGDPADKFCIILAGLAKLSVTKEDGSQTVVEVIEPVSTFGIPAMISLGRFPVTCEVILGTRIIEIPKSTFFRRVREQPDIVLKILSGMARREQRLARSLRRLKMLTPIMRLATYLVELADTEQTGAFSVELPYNKSLLAGVLGITPESLSRLFAKARELGVSTRGNRVNIADIDALRLYCDTGVSTKALGS